MSSNRSLALSGVVAAIIAIAIVFGAVFVGVLNTTTGVETQTAQGNGNSETSAVFTQTETSSTSQTQTSAVVTSSTSPTSGGLAVLMTDPPTVPNGVTATYITYANLGVHVSGAGNQTGWRVFKTVGQIDLMSVINSTQTVATANLSAGTFNALAFNVTSAIVTFQSRNFTADLVSKNHLLFSPIPGGVTVTDGAVSAAVVDFTPTVLLIGNQSNPEFAFVPVARAYSVPAQSVGTLHLKTGDRDDIHAAPWWIQILRGSKFEITKIALTPSKISISITNSGNSSIFFKLADISSAATLSPGSTQLPNLASMLSISELFAMESNATLSPVIEIGNGVADAVIDSGGYLMPVGASVTFTFNGNISLGIAQNPASLHPVAIPQLIIPGKTYVLTLIGNGVIAEAKVTASSQ